MLAQLTPTDIWQGLASPIFWAAFLGATGVWLMLPGERRRARRVGYMLAVVAALLAIYNAAGQFNAALFSTTFTYPIFWVATVAVFIGALAMCIVRSKVAAAVFVLLAALAGGIWVTLFNGDMVAAFMVIALAVASSALVLFRSPRTEANVGGALAALALGVLAAAVLPQFNELGDRVNFWSLATLTLGAAVATISMRSPVYSAIWFALTLLGVAGLFLLQGAQFLSVATIAVYAGAILVTFLFVLMLAQPEGHDYYDRISWGWFPTAFASLAAALLIGGLAWRLTNLEGAPEIMAGGEAALADGVLAENHVARFGGFLFSHHIVSLEVTGALLMAALVGAIAIVVQSKKPSEAATATTIRGDENGR